VLARQIGVAEEVDVPGAVAPPVPRATVTEHSGRYRPLWLWLTTKDPVEFRADFSEIERAMGMQLPGSCRAHIAHWHSYQGSAVARANIDAGWHANHVDLAAQALTLSPGAPPRARMS
jgi:hypothetical protein